MKYKKLTPDDTRPTFALIFDTGDEVMQTLQDFARQHNLNASHFTAIGAFSDATIAWFNYDKREYKKMSVAEQVEVLMLSGDVATRDGKPTVHAHIVLGRSDGNAIGGHLMEAHVRPTLEVILEETPAHLRKTMDEETGLALIDLDASSGPTQRHE